MEKCVKKNSNNDKHIQLFKQFIKYKNHLLKIKKNKEIESINKKIQNEINRINLEEKNNNIPLNKNYLNIIKGSINIIEYFWKKKCLNKHKIIEKSSNLKDFSNTNYRTYHPKFYENYFPLFNSLRIIDNSDKFICHNKIRKNLTDIFRNRDYLSSIIKKILIREKRNNQFNNIKENPKRPLIININYSDNKTHNINDLKKENMLNIKSCIIKINEKIKYQSNYFNYLKEFKNNIKDNTKNKLKSPQKIGNKKDYVKQKSSKHFKNNKNHQEYKNKNKSFEIFKNEIKEIKIINYIQIKQNSKRKANNIHLIKKKNENKKFNFIKKNNRQIKEKDKNENENEIIPKYIIEAQSEKTIKKFKEIKDRIKECNKDIQNKKFKLYRSFSVQYEKKDKFFNDDNKNKNKNSIEKKIKNEVEKINNILVEENSKNPKINIEGKEENETKTNNNDNNKKNNIEKNKEEIKSNNEYINNNYSLDLQKSSNNNIDDNNYNLKEETLDSFNENYIYEENNYFNFEKLKITNNNVKNNIYKKKFPQNSFTNNNNSKRNENIKLSNSNTYEIKEIDSNYFTNKEEIKNDTLNESHNSKIKITEESKNNSSIEPITEENMEIFQNIENNFNFSKKIIKTNIFRDKIEKENLDKKNNSEIIENIHKDILLLKKNKFFCMTEINKKNDINEMLNEKNNKIKFYLGLSLHHSKSHDLTIISTISTNKKFRTQLINSDEINLTNKKILFNKKEKLSSHSQKSMLNKSINSSYKY